MQIDRIRDPVAISLDPEVRPDGGPLAFVRYVGDLRDGPEIISNRTSGSPDLAENRELWQRPACRNSYGAHVDAGATAYIILHPAIYRVIR